MAAIAACLDAFEASPELRRLVADELGVEVELLSPVGEHQTDPAEPTDPSIAAIVAIGTAQEHGRTDRAGRGAVYTPWDVAVELIEHAAPDGAVCDPACGAGVFLLAAAERFRRRGASLEQVVQWLRGYDVDRETVAVARSSLALWAWWRYRTALGPDELAEIVQVADVLTTPPAPPAGGAARFDVVVGNPPYLGQMKDSTRRDAQRRSALAERFRDVVRAYTDEAILFALAAVDLVGDGGRVMLLMPRSVSAAADAAGVRRRLDEVAPMDAIWLGSPSTFANAAVHVVAPRLVRGLQASEIAVVGSGAERTVARPSDGDWARMLAAIDGLPSALPERRDEATLGSIARATADFRDRYYDLAEMVVEDDGIGALPKLATVGLVDPLWFRHGSTWVRFAKRRFERPVVQVDAAPSAVTTSWLTQRLVPKLLVATQTKLLEVVVDVDGALVPSTPLVIVEPNDRRQIWSIAAVLCAPVTSAWLAAESAGSGLSPGTFRVRAGQLLDLPLPTDDRAWATSANLVEELAGRRPTTAQLVEIAAAMNEAYELDGAQSAELLQWWRERLPERP